MLALLVIGSVLLAPFLLDTYMVNILIRAFFVAIAAVTVDIMWAIAHANIRSVGLLRHWCLCACDRLHRIRFWHLADPFRGGGGHHHLRVVAALTGWLSFIRVQRALRIDRVACRSDRPRTDSLLGRHIHGSSSGLVGFETFDLSLESWFRLAGLGLACVAAVALVLMRSDTGRLLKALRIMTSAAAISASIRRASHHRLVLTAIVAALAGFGTPLLEEWPRRKMPVSRSEPVIVMVALGAAAPSSVPSWER